MWNNSHGKLTGSWQKNSYTIKASRKIPCNQVGWEKNDCVGICTHGKYMYGRDGPHKWTLTLRSEQVKPQSGHPSPGVLSRRVRPPFPVRLRNLPKEPIPLVMSTCMLACWQSGQRAMHWQLTPHCTSQSKRKNTPALLTLYHSLAWDLSRYLV